MTAITRRQLDKLIGLAPDRWHQATMQMAWYFRTDGAHPMPPVILAAFKGVEPDRSTWDTWRQRVNSRRKAARADERRYSERQKRERRRLYMRKYMKDYRARDQNG